MTQVITIKDTTTEADVPAEVRVIEPGQRLLVLVRDFDSAKLEPVEMIPIGDSWRSADGRYTSDYQFSNKPIQVLIRVPKKPK